MIRGTSTTLLTLFGSYYNLDILKEYTHINELFYQSAGALCRTADYIALFLKALLCLMSFKTNQKPHRKLQSHMRIDGMDFFISARKLEFTG